MGENYLKSVRKQYENFPYPLRDPKEERHVIRPCNGESLDQINHFIYGGENSFEGSKVLIAGGGTGDSTIYYAEQLRKKGGHVTYIDFSNASMEIARKRAEFRYLDNITFICDSILNIPKLNLGEFDIINCSGVLHHLADPSQGLNILRDSLKEDGVMTLMVYAKIGRQPIYIMQELLRKVNKGIDDDQEKIDNCKKILDSLYEKHPLNIVGGVNAYENQEDGDIVLYDLFLHSQDVAYTITELHEFVGNSGLQIPRLFGNHHFQGNQLYNPDIYITDLDIRSQVNKLDEIKRKQIAEMLHGSIVKHTFYARKQPARIAELSDLSMIPCVSILFDNDVHNILYQLAQSQGQEMQFYVDALKCGVRFNKTQHTNQLFKYMDGQRSLKDIFDNIVAQNFITGGQATYKSLLEEFTHIFEAFNLHNWMFLRKSSVPRFEPLPSLQNYTDKLIKKEAAC